MKKFRLISKYPGYPVLGTIVTIEPKQETGYYSENKEFWEEIVEKDYEILEYISKENILFKSPFLKDSHDFYIKQGCKIKSVKRLKDDEIFSIGDKVDSTVSDLGTSTNLTNIRLENNELLVGLKFVGFCPLSTILKDKQPLFKTENGVNIFEGCVFYGVWKDCKGQASHLNSDKPTIARLKSNSDGMFTFSSKKAAEEYINLRKPYLSNYDVLQEIINCTDIEQVRKIFTNKVAN